MLLNEMEIFYYVIEQQSFSKAAERLNVSKSFISKKITHLEQDLQTKLITRSTRKLTLTDSGKNFFNFCAHIVEQGEEAYALMSNFQKVPSGRLKISIPPAIAIHLIQPILKDFLLKYPDITLDIQLESQIVDLVKEGYDLAFRAAKLPSSNLIVQKISATTQTICATPVYLQTHSPLTTVNDLNNHHFALYHQTKVINIKHRHSNATESIQIKGNVYSNQLDFIKQFVMCGTSLGILPTFMVAQDLQNKTLVACLTDYTLPKQNIYAIYPERKYMPPKLKLFLDLVKKHFKNG